MGRYVEDHPNSIYTAGSIKQTSLRPLSIKQTSLRTPVHQTDKSSTDIQIVIEKPVISIATEKVDKIDVSKSEDVSRNIGKIKKNLIKHQDLKPIFLKMKRELPSIITGSTMDHELMKQIINLLFCKIYDEKSKGDEDVMEFRADISDTPKTVKERIDILFEGVKSLPQVGIFSDVDRIEFNIEAVFYLVKELQDYNIQESKNDTIGDVFETFTGKSLKGELGQFFTPRNVADMMVRMISIKPTDILVDPACGSGGFLTSASMYIKKEFPEQMMSEPGRANRGEAVATGQTSFVQNIRGIDRDSFLCRIATVHMNLISNQGKLGGIFCDDSLLEPSEWRWNIRDSINFGKFDIVLMNPPFGIDVGKIISQRYIFGGKKTYKQSHILFVKRGLDLLKPGGKMGIILPESFLSNETSKEALEYIRIQARIIAVVSLPEIAFAMVGGMGTTAKTVCLFVEKRFDEQPYTKAENYEIFMAIIKDCGKSIGSFVSKRDETSLVSKNYFERTGRSELGFYV